MEIHFHRVYEVADLMADLVDVYGAFDELDWDSPDVSGCLTNFSKTSLLAHFCFAHLCIHDRKRCRKNPETVDVDSIEGPLSGMLFRPCRLTIF